MKTILAIALAFGLVGCVDETTPEGIDGIEEEFDDLGPDTHKSDVDQTEPTDEEQPLDFTQEPQTQLLENGDPREAPVTEAARQEAQRLVETGARAPLQSRTPVQGLVETGRKPLESRTPVEGLVETGRKPLESRTPRPTL